MSLSTADPPLLTALAVGHATITAGTGSADVTVSAGDPNYPGTLPLGTVLWSVPGNVTKIVPAVPSPSGVADVFAFQCENFDPSQSPSCWGDVTVQAITSDGTTAWTASLSVEPILPDFQGGLVNVDSDTGSIVKVDGTTGQINVLYTPLGEAFPDDRRASRWHHLRRSGTKLVVDGLPPNSVIGFDLSGTSSSATRPGQREIE